MTLSPGGQGGEIYSAWVNGVNTPCHRQNVLLWCNEWSPKISPILIIQYDTHQTPYRRFGPAHHAIGTNFFIATAADRKVVGQRK